MDADPHAEARQPGSHAFGRTPLKGSLHFECGAHGMASAAFLRPGQSARAHVRITYGLDLLEAMPHADGIEQAETSIDLAHQSLCVHLLAQSCEVGEIGEEDGYALHLASLGAAMLLEFLGDGSRKDVVQEAIAPFLLHADQVAGPAHEAQSVP